MFLIWILSSVIMLKDWSRVTLHSCNKNERPGCLLKPKYFCVVYDYAGKADLFKGLLEFKKKIGGNHAVFREY